MLHYSSGKAWGHVSSAVVDILKLSHSQMTSRARPMTVIAVLKEVPAPAYCRPVWRLTTELQSISLLQTVCKRMNKYQTNKEWGLWILGLSFTDTGPRASWVLVAFRQALASTPSFSPPQTLFLPISPLSVAAAVYCVVEFKQTIRTLNIVKLSETWVLCARLTGSLCVWVHWGEQVLGVIDEERVKRQQNTVDDKERRPIVTTFERIGHFCPLWNGRSPKDISQCP